MRLSNRFALVTLILSLATPATAADWTYFHQVKADRGTLNYYYDKSSVRAAGSMVALRMKVLGTLVHKPMPETITIADIQINCRTGTFTEIKTLIVDPNRRSRLMPKSELLIDHAIEPGTSSDKLRRSLCP